MLVDSLLLGLRLGLDFFSCVRLFLDSTFLALCSSISSSSLSDSSLWEGPIQRK